MSTESSEHITYDAAIKVWYQTDVEDSRMCESCHSRLDGKNALRFECAACGTEFCAVPPATTTCCTMHRLVELDADETARLGTEDSITTCPLYGQLRKCTKCRVVGDPVAWRDAVVRQVASSLNLAAIERDFDDDMARVFCSACYCDLTDNGVHPFCISALAIQPQQGPC